MSEAHLQAAGEIDLDRALAELPLIAILRGIRPEEAAAVGLALVESGFRLIEVTLNSFNPFRSIEILSDECGKHAVIGAGTVTRPAEAERVMDAGGRLVVMPHADVEVIRAAKVAGAWCIPGTATPTEALAALRAGADALKLFPAEMLPPAVVKAWMAILPTGTRLLPVGSITFQVMDAYLEAGAVGFGIGSGLYRPGMEPVEVARRATDLVRVWRQISA